MTYTDADRAEALARSDRYAGAEERRANHRDAIAAALAAVRAEERAAIAAYIAGPVAAYDRASEQWQKANAEQDDAPSVKDAERYSDALENVAHSFVAALRYLVDANPPAAVGNRLAVVSAVTGAAMHVVQEWAASSAEYGDLVAGATPAEDVERFRAWNANRGPVVVGDRSTELRVLRAAERNGTRVVYVVNWTPQGVGGFEWRWNRDSAERVARDQRLFGVHPDRDETVQIHAVELPAEVGDDVEGITAWLDSAGWSDGGDPRV